MKKKLLLLSHENIHFQLKSLPNDKSQVIKIGLNFTNYVIVKTLFFKNDFNVM